MQFLLEHKRWKKVKQILKKEGLKKLPRKIVSPNICYHNFTLPLNPPEWYPRVHVITTVAEDAHLRLIEVHVDIVPHKQTEPFHKEIDRIASIIKHTK